MKKAVPAFKSRAEEADYWMTHDTAKFWDAFEDVSLLPTAAPSLVAAIHSRHSRTKAISLRLYPEQIRKARVIARRQHMPYQTLLRNLIESGLERAAAGK